jgi:hypothetical protein
MPTGGYLLGGDLSGPRVRTACIRAFVELGVNLGQRFEKVFAHNGLTPDSLHLRKGRALCYTDPPFVGKMAREQTQNYECMLCTWNGPCF